MVETIVKEEENEDKEGEMNKDVFELKTVKQVTTNKELDQSGVRIRGTTGGMVGEETNSSRGTYACCV